MVIDIDIIYKEHYQLFVNFANKIIGNREDAKDIAHNVVANFCFKEHDDIKDVKAYLLQAIRSRCLNYKQHVAVRREYQKHILSSQSEGAEYETSFDRLASELLLKRIHELIPQLSSQQQEIFAMSFFYKMSLVEIAGKMGLKKSTVRVQYKRCIDFFRENIKTRAA